MAIELAEKYLPYTDELFAAESKTSILTNQDFDWTNAHTVKIYRISSSEMNDYGRSGPDSANWSRYGAVAALDATTQSMTLRNDRSFTFAIDRLDQDETVNQMEAASALARQLREVVVPEVDQWVYAQMCENAGIVASPEAITADNIFDLIVEGNRRMDDVYVPDTGRHIVVTPAVFMMMKKSRDIVLETDIGADMRLRGVIGNLDGANVIRVPESRLPDDFGFLICHPVATVAPVKLASYKVHEDPPGISGSLVEGRINYDAFVLDNKAKALYYQAQA